MAFKRIALAPIGLLESVDGSKLVFASEGDKEVSFDYSPDDFVYFRCRAITADESNGNGDYFPTDELKKAYKSFVGVGLYKDHDSDSVEKSIGKVLWAEWIEDGKYVECYCAVDKQLAPELAHRVRNGIINSVSMGASVQEAECSICKNVAHNVNELCECMTPGVGVKGRHDNRGKIIYEINRGVQFNELSLVTVPADSTARIFEVYASLNRKAADADVPDYEDMSLPALEEYFNKLSQSANTDVLKKAAELAKLSAKKYIYYSNPAFLVTEQMAASVAFSGARVLDEMQKENPWAMPYFWDWMANTHVRPGVFGPLSYPDAVRWFDSNNSAIMDPRKALYGGDIIDAATEEAIKKYPGFDPASVAAKKKMIAAATQQANKVARQNAKETFAGDPRAADAAAQSSKDFERMLRASFKSYYHSRDVQSVRAIYGENLHYMGGIPPDLKEKYGGEINAAFRKPVLDRFSGKTKTAIYAKLVEYYSLVDQAYAIAYGKKEKKITPQDKEKLEKEIAPKIDALVYNFYKTNVSTTDRGGKNVLDFVCEQGNIFNTVLFGTQKAAEAAGFWSPGVITDRTSESTEESLDTRFKNFFDTRELTSTRTISKPGAGEGEEKQKGEYAHRSERLKKNPPLLQDFISTYNYKLGLDLGLYERSLRENGYSGKVMAPEDKWIEAYIDHLKTTYKMTDVKIGAMLEKSQFDTAQYINFMPDVANVQRMNTAPKPSGTEKKIIEQDQAARDQMLEDRLKHRENIENEQRRFETERGEQEVAKKNDAIKYLVQLDSKPVIDGYNALVASLSEAVAAASVAGSGKPQELLDAAGKIHIPQVINFESAKDSLNETSIPAILPVMYLMSSVRTTLMRLINGSIGLVDARIASSGNTDRSKHRISMEGDVVDAGVHGATAGGLSQNGWRMKVTYGLIPGWQRAQNYSTGNVYTSEVTDDLRKRFPGQFRPEETNIDELFHSFNISSGSPEDVSKYSDTVSKFLSRGALSQVAEDAKKLTESVKDLNDKAISVQPELLNVKEETKQAYDFQAEVEDKREIPSDLTPFVGVGCHGSDLERLLSSAKDAGVQESVVGILQEFLPIFVIARQEIINGSSYSSVGDLVEAFVNAKGNLSGVLGYPVTIFDDFISGAIQMRMADDVVKKTDKYKEIFDRLYLSKDKMHEGISDEDADALVDFSNMARVADVNMGFDKEQPVSGIASAIGLDPKRAEEVLREFSNLSVGVGVPKSDPKERRDEKGNVVRVKDKNGNEVPLNRKPKRGEEQEYLTEMVYDTEEKGTPLSARYEALEHVIADGAKLLSRINKDRGSINDAYNFAAKTIFSSKVALEGDIRKIIQQSGQSFNPEYMAKAVSSPGSSVGFLRDEVMAALSSQSGISKDLVSKFSEAKKGKYSDLLDMMGGVPKTTGDISQARVVMQNIATIMSMIDPEDFEYMPQVKKIVANGTASIEKAEAGISDIEAAYTELDSIGFSKESGGKHLYFKEDLGFKIPYRQYGDVVVAQKNTPMQWMLRYNNASGQEDVGLDGDSYHRGFAAMRNIYLDLNRIEEIVKQRSAQTDKAFDSFLEDFYAGGDVANAATRPDSPKNDPEMDPSKALPTSIEDSVKFFDNIERLLVSDEAKAYVIKLRKIQNDAGKFISENAKSKDGIDAVVEKMAGIELPQPPTANIPNLDKLRIDFFHDMMWNLLMFGNVHEGSGLVATHKKDYGLGDTAKGKRNSQYFDMVSQAISESKATPAGAPKGGVGISDILDMACLRGLESIPLDINSIGSYVDSFIAKALELNDKAISALAKFGLEETGEKKLAWFLANDIRAAKSNVFNLYKDVVAGMKGGKDGKPADPSLAAKMLDSIIDGVTKLSSFAPVGTLDSMDEAAMRFVLSAKDALAAGGALPPMEEFKKNVQEPKEDAGEPTDVKAPEVKKAPSSMKDIKHEIELILGHIWTETHTPGEEDIKFPAGISLGDAASDPDARNSIAVSFVSENWPALMASLGEINYKAHGGREKATSLIQAYAHDVALSLVEGTVNALAAAGHDMPFNNNLDGKFSNMEEFKVAVRQIIEMDWARKTASDTPEKMFYGVPVIDIIKNEKARNWFIDAYTFTVYEEVFKLLSSNLNYAAIGGVQKVRVEAKKVIDEVVTAEVLKYIESVSPGSTDYINELKEYEAWKDSVNIPADPEEIKKSESSYPEGSVGRAMDEAIYEINVDVESACTAAGLTVDQKAAIKQQEQSLITAFYTNYTSGAKQLPLDDGHKKDIESWKEYIISESLVAIPTPPAAAPEQKKPEPVQYRSWPPMNREETEAYEKKLQEDRNKFTGTPSWNEPMHTIVGE